MRWSAISAVWLKELREALRDRRTLITTLVVPTVVVPLMIFAAGTIMMKVIGKAKTESSEVMVLGGEDSPRAMKVLSGTPKLLLSPASADWRARIADKKVRLVVEIPAGFDARLAAGEKATLKLYHYEGEMRSGMTLGEVRKSFMELRDALVVERLASRGLSSDFVKPFDLKSENVAPPEKVGGNAVGGIIPYMFILFCFSGALYPAIDITAGEKERGTLETILCSPISRLELVLGKFLTVFTAAGVTVLCSLVSMSVTVLAGGSFLLGHSGGAGQASGGAFMMIDQLGILAIVVLALPVAALFAAGLLAIALNARTTKEAQSSTAPLIVLIILPAMMGMLPGVELNAKLAFVPILNLALASKEVLSGVWHWSYLALVFLSSLSYAALALAWCVRQFNRESVLFRG